MRKLGIALGVAVILAAAAPALADDGAQVKHSEGVWACSVGFDETDSFADLDWDCDIVNISRPDGGYTLVIHAQVQPHRMDDFQASGIRQFESRCFAAYLFVVQDEHIPVFTDSTRHFTPDGKMTETCNYVP